MANYTKTITNEGAALLASVIANQGTLTFNEFRFSENDYTGQESTLTEVTFLGVFITAGAAASVIDSTTIKASAQFNNSTITGNHDLYSIGIIGTDGNTTALIAVCTTTDPDVIREPLTGTSTYAFNVNLAVSSTSDITVTGTTAAVVYNSDSINVLSDVDAPTPSDNDLLIYKGSTSKWTAQANPFSNENLLDNPFFTVNQRGATGAISTLGAYVSDRWRLTAVATVTVAGDALTLSTGAQISQKRETGLVSGKTYTLSIKLSNGDIEHATGTYNGEAAKAFLDNANFEAGYVSAGYDIYIYAKSEKTITAVKLEVGSVSTLANDVAPDYTTELLKCQRYFYRILSNSSSAFIAVGFMADSHTFYGTINLPVPMRGTPTSLVDGVMQIYTTGGTEDVSTLLINMRSPQILTIAATIGNSLTVNSPAILMGAANSYIDISADL